MLTTEQFEHKYKYKYLSPTDNNNNNHNVCVLWHNALNSFQNCKLINCGKRACADAKNDMRYVYSLQIQF